MIHNHETRMRGTKISVLGENAKTEQDDIPTPCQHLGNADGIGGAVPLFGLQLL